MGSDDITRNQPNVDDVKETQPTITAVFRLIQDVENRLIARLDGLDTRFDRLDTRFDGVDTRFDGVDTRFDGVDTRLDALSTRLDKTDARLDQLEDRLARDIEAVNTRITEGFKELGHKINALNRRTLQTEADYEDLSERVGRLESKAS